MKFTVNQKDLATKLAQVVSIVPSRPSHPVLANVMLKTEEGRLGLSAFDLSIGLEIWIAATVETEGAITIPARFLGEIISRLPSLDIVFEIDNGIASIKCGSGSYTIPTLPVDDFPELPSLSEVIPLQMDGATLKAGMQAALFVASTDESKQVLTGLHVATTATGLEIAATDGHRLAVARYPDGAASSSIEATIPAKALRELDKILGADSVDIRSDRAQIVFEVKGDHGVERLTSRLLEGQYPAYNQLIPRSFSIELKVSRQALISAIDRIAVLAARKNNIIKLSVDKTAQSVYLSAEAPEFGSGQESIDAVTNGSIEVAFNVKYLSEGVKAIRSEEIAISMNASTTPAVISEPGNDGYTYLLMPIQIRG